MNKSVFCCVIGVSALAFAQARIVFKDSRKSPKIQIEGNRGMIVPDTNFELTGNVVINNFEQKLKLTCEKAAGDLIKSDGVSQFDNVKLTGGVKAFLDDAETNAQTTSSSAFYNLVGKEQAELSLQGSVALTIRNGAKGVNNDSVVTAQSAKVTINRKAKEQDRLVSAKLDGGILFKGLQIKKEEGKVTSQRLEVKAEEATYTKAGKSGKPEFQLQGNLVFLQNPDEEGGVEVTGAQRAIFELDETGKVTRIQFSSDGQSTKKPIRTVIKKKGGGV
jgi:hypothetical protein